MSSDARRGCQQRFWGLLAFVDRAPGDTKPCIYEYVPAIGFINNEAGACDGDDACSHIKRLVDLTPECDVFKDLSTMRRDLSESLGSERMQEIRQTKGSDYTETSLKNAAQAIIHHRSAHRRELISALSWPNRLLYAWRNM